MSLRSRVKGKVGERKVATMLRGLMPGAVVRRTSQAESAHNADVIVDQGPTAWQRLWIEVTDSRAPNPKKKLAQAERDAPADRWPVVVWHRTGERTWWATMRAGTLWGTLGTLDRDRWAYLATPEGKLIATLDAVEFLTCLRDRPVEDWRSDNAGTCNRRVGYRRCGNIECRQCRPPTRA